MDHTVRRLNVGRDEAWILNVRIGIDQGKGLGIHTNRSALERFDFLRRQNLAGLQAFTRDMVCQHRCQQLDGIVSAVEQTQCVNKVCKGSALIAAFVTQRVRERDKRVIGRRKGGKVGIRVIQCARQISRDHNPVSEMLRVGALSAEEAERHPERHVLSQSLGVTPDMPLAPGHLHGTLKPGQQIILCSDGLTDELTDQRIARIMRDNPEPQAQVDALIKAAIDAGGHDNVTVVVVGEPPSEEDGMQLSGHDTLRTAAAIEPGGSFLTHDQMIWGLAALMVILALLFVL